MATYFFETITAAHALAMTGGDTICFASNGNAGGGGGGGRAASKPKPDAEPKPFAEAAAEADTDAEPTGSTLFSDKVAVGDQAFPARVIVQGAVQMSGLSVEEWNALGETEIDRRLKGVLEGMNATWRAARGAGGALVYDPLNPGKASLRMAQAVTVHKHEEGKAPEPYSLKLGMNHDVPSWVAEHEFVQENLDKS